MKQLAIWYLKLLAKIVVARHHPEVIAITGSTNKTVVKKLIARVLRTRFTVRENLRSYNTEVGLPLAVLGLESGNGSIGRWAKVLIRGTGQALFSSAFPQKLVVEYGVDSPREMDYLLSILKPTIVVVTDTAPVYQEAFGTVDALAHEYAKLVEVVPETGYVVLNYDNEHVRLMAKTARGHVVFVSIHETIPGLYGTLESTARATTLSIHEGERQFSYILDSVGQHHATALLLALGVAHYYSIETQQALDALSHPA